MVGPCSVLRLEGGRAELDAGLYWDQRVLRDNARRWVPSSTFLGPMRPSVPSFWRKPLSDMVNQSAACPRVNLTTML